MNSTERIEKLLELMESHSLNELELEEKDFRVRLAKQAPALLAAPQVAAPVVPAGGVAPAAGPDRTGLVPVKSPIVGTFYKSPAPDADPFVKIGDTIGEDTVVCIVEAMKVMNEVKSGVNGAIAEILVQNGEAVEFDQPLFMVRPS